MGLSARERRFRIAAGVMATLFAVSAIVQWNDPDPLAWIVLYGIAAVLAAAAAVGKLPFAPNLGAFVLFAVLAVLWLPSLNEARAEAFTSVQMQAASDEEPRETLGLMICALWSAAASWRAWFAR